MPEEARQLRKTLDQAAQHGLAKIIERPNVTLKEILDVFQDARYRNRIAIFHYGGHANGYQLLLESASGQTVVANAGGLAAFLGQQSGLQLVFFNGCSTQPQVEGLLAAGVPAVIATAQAIDDAVAMEFAARFYHGLANGVALRLAYDQAVAAVQSDRGSQNPRGLYWGQTDQPADRWPWEFYLKAGAGPVADWSLPQAAGDYLFGPPELPPLDLPPNPFRHLYWFEREHAPLFFGREQTIRELYQRVTDPETAPLILLYGQSGVGKSSLLAAGLWPRLERDYTLCYQRRDPAQGLAGSLATALQLQAQPTSPGHRWRELEQASGRPLIIILDQVEEVFTRPLAGSDEFKGFLAALSDIFAAIEQRPRGKLILGFRKEWLAEIEQRLTEQRLPLAKIFLERLDFDDIVRVVRGPAQTPRLQAHYGLTVAGDLPELIAGDLLADPESPIAPTLQILLTKLWAEATKENPGHPHFSVELYQRLKKEGILLADFLNQQLGQLGSWQPQVESSGLALDVLAYHTTPLGTAAGHSRTDLIETYAHQAEVLPQLVQKCQDLYLLVDLAKNRPDQAGASQLAHDTLAPLVRRQFDESDRPGQRARRILESRAVEWANGQTGPSLDEINLALVEQGQAGMRAWTKAEKRLGASQPNSQRETRTQSSDGALDISCGWDLSSDLCRRSYLAVDHRSRENSSRSRCSS